VRFLYTSVQRLSVSQASGRVVSRSVFQSMGWLVAFTNCSADCVTPGNFAACSRPLIDYKHLLCLLCGPVAAPRGCGKV